MKTNWQIKNSIEQALVIFYRTDKKLIDDRTHEQTISARLMIYLQHIFPHWNVDVEYNRQGKDRSPKTDSSGVRRRPDIIIHKRGSNKSNLVVLLIKCEWNKELRENDHNILKDLKNKYNYQNAFFIEIKKDKYQLIEFKDEN